MTFFKRCQEVRNADAFDIGRQSPVGFFKDFYACLTQRTLPSTAARPSTLSHRNQIEFIKKQSLGRERLVLRFPVRPGVVVVEQLKHVRTGGCE